MLAAAAGPARATSVGGSWWIYDVPDAWTDSTASHAADFQKMTSASVGTIAEVHSYASGTAEIMVMVGGAPKTGWISISPRARTARRW